MWTCLVSFSVIRCLIAPLGPVDACAAVIMIYSRAAVWGSLLLASSVSLGIWAAAFSAQFVNDEIQQAASATPRKQGRMRGPLPQAVSGKGWAPLKHGGLGAWRMRWGGCGKTDLRFPGLCLRPGFSHQLAPGAKHFTPLSLSVLTHTMGILGISEVPAAWSHLEV